LERYRKKQHSHRDEGKNEQLWYSIRVVENEQPGSVGNSAEQIDETDLGQIGFFALDTTFDGGPVTYHSLCAFLNWRERETKESDVYRLAAKDRI